MDACTQNNFLMSCPLSDRIFYQHRIMRMLLLLVLPVTWNMLHGNVGARRDLNVTSLSCHNDERYV